MMSAAAAAGVARNSNNNRFPFTASQWQELEHQALVYKYMISGMPIPPELLFTIKRSLVDSSPKFMLQHQPPHHSIGWNCFQMGFGRKIDPEPGRCRRTDGKKWRCSKEAYPDSKYCERHMHRGRNRSRKPVEVNNNNNISTINLSTPRTPPPPTAIPMIPSSVCAKSPNYPSPNSHPLSSDYYNSQLSSYSSYNYNSSSSNGNSNSINSPFLYPSSSRSPGGIGNVLSSQDQFLLESSPYSHSDKDFSYGMKEEVDEHPFFSEASGTMKRMSASPMGDSWHLEPLAMNNCSSKQRTLSDYQNSYPYLQLQSMQRQQQKQDQSYYDHLASRIEQKDEPQKVMHHFFDEWPPNDNDNNNKDTSTTQLSISVPSSARDFFLNHNDK